MGKKPEEQLNVELLNEAFETFNQATEKLQSSYNHLQKEASKLRNEVEEKNKQLEEMSSLTQAIIMNTTSAMIATDDKNNILIKNKSAEELEKDYGGSFFNNYIFSVSSERPSEIQYDYNHFRVSRGNFASGKYKGSVFVIDDVTEIKKLEKEQQRNEKLKLMGEMAANIAHEIRNPLGSIELFASLLKRDLSEDSEKNRLTDSIVKGVRTINSTISNILLFTKEIKINKSEIHLSDIVDDVVLFMGHLIKDKSINFQNKINEDHTIYCDVELMKQVIMNILHNSIEAVDNGGFVGITSKVENNETCIIIQDNGCGISSEFIQNLFVPFQTTKAKGTGLGLSIVYKIIKAHGGNIIPDSDGKSYTMFTIKIPDRSR